MHKECWISPDQAREALSLGTGRNVRVAVLDSGIETSHSSLSPLKLADDVIIESHGGKISSDEGCGEDVFGHGTAVAAILRQGAPEVELGSFRVLGHFKQSRAKVIREGVREAALRGYHIIQCSFGAPARAENAAIYTGWLNALYLRGIHVIASGSNAGFQTPEWPAYFPTVIAVGASPDNNPTLSLTQGSMVEFAINGHESTASWRGGETREVFGSSFAAPRVTAMLARILSVHPDLHPLHAKSLLRHLASAAPDQVHTVPMQDDTRRARSPSQGG